MKLSRFDRLTVSSLLLCSALLSGCGKPKAPSTGSGRRAPVPTPTPFSVTGRVLLNGVPLPEIVIKMDPACEKLQTNTPTTHHYVVAPNRGLADVFVTIRAEFDPKMFPTPTNAGRISVVACQYVPHVIGVRTGQPMDFENNSDVLDNWHVTPKLNPEFNFVGLSGQIETKTFQKAEDFIRVKCDVHPWMFAYICVVDHPFFAITDTNGSFTLPDTLPDGTYTLEARHLKAGSQQKQITVRKGTMETVEFELTAPKRLQTAVPKR